MPHSKIVFHKDLCVSHTIKCTIYLVLLIVTIYLSILSYSKISCLEESNFNHIFNLESQYITMKVIDNLHYNNNSIVGISTLSYWEKLLPEIVGNQIYCIISNTTDTLFTFLLSQEANATIITNGYFTSKNYRTVVSIDTFSQSGYSMTLYPTEDYINEYITSLANTAAIFVACSMLIPITLLTIFFYSSYGREKMLIERVSKSLYEAAASVAIIEARKIYVRYISHVSFILLDANYLDTRLYT